MIWKYIFTYYLRPPHMYTMYFDCIPHITAQTS